MAKAADHARHDSLDVAAGADRGASLPAALRLCRGCLELYADLTAVAAAIPLAALPRRPRDFMLSPVDAARLRPRGLRRLLEAFGSARDEISRPLALGFTSLGLVGLVLTAAPTVLPMTGLGGSAASVAPYAEMGVEHSPAADTSGTPLGPQGAGGKVSPDAREGVAGVDRGPLLVVSGAFLGAGGVLLGARAIAKRRDPVR